MDAAMAVEPRPEIDPDVLERARSGDEDAFGRLVRHYDSGLRALAFRLLGDRGAMDDALQEAYLKAFRALPRFRGESAPGTWLYRIAYNACLDELRRAGRHRTTALDEIREQADPGADSGEAVEARDRLARALSNLPADQRAVVVLVDAQGFDYASAGEVLGVPAGTVGSRLSIARATLRKELEQEEEGDG